MDVTKSVRMLERNRIISDWGDNSKVLDRYQEPMGLLPLRDTKTHKRQTDGHTHTFQDEPMQTFRNTFITSTV